MIREWLIRTGWSDSPMLKAFRRLPDYLQENFWPDMPIWFGLETLKWKPRHEYPRNELRTEWRYRQIDEVLNGHAGAAGSERTDRFTATTPGRAAPGSVEAAQGLVVAGVYGASGPAAINH